VVKARETLEDCLSEILEKEAPQKVKTLERRRQQGLCGRGKMTIPSRVILCGIGYRVAVADEAVIFSAEGA